MNRSAVNRLMERVYSEYHDAFVRFVSCRCGVAGDRAEDRVQDMYVRFGELLENGGFVVGTSVDMVVLGRYLYGFLRRHTAYLRRTERRRSELLEERAQPGPSSEAEARLLASLHCLEILDRMDSGDAQLLRWRYLDGLSNLEAAKRLAISPGAVRVRVHRALERAREIEVESRVL